MLKEKLPPLTEKQILELSLPDAVQMYAEFCRYCPEKCHNPSLLKDQEDGILEYILQRCNTSNCTVANMHLFDLQNRILKIVDEE